MGAPLLDFKEEKWQRGGHIIRINIIEIRFGKWRNWAGVITSGNISVGDSLAGDSEPQGSFFQGSGFPGVPVCEKQLGKTHQTFS